MNYVPARGGSSFPVSIPDSLLCGEKISCLPVGVFNARQPAEEARGAFTFHNERSVRQRVTRRLSPLHQPGVRKRSPRGKGTRFSLERSCTQHFTEPGGPAAALASVAQSLVRPNERRKEATHN